MPPSPPLPASPGDDRPWPTVSVVLPALNEEANLPLVLQGLPTVDEVIVVDGGSTDATVAVARKVRPDAVVVRQTRTGKGNALVCGFAACTSDIVVTLNSDGSTDPGEIPRYVAALLAGAEVAHGSRYREGGGNLNEARWERYGNQCYNRLVNVVFGTRFTDLGYGYNAYWRALLPVLDLPVAEARTLRRDTRFWGDGPEIEPLINIRMATQGLRVVEVASVGYPRIYGVRERHPVRNGALAARTAAAEFVRRWRIGRQAARHPGVHAFRDDSRSRARHSVHQFPAALPAAPPRTSGAPLPRSAAVPLPRSTAVPPTAVPRPAAPPLSYPGATPPYPGTSTAYPGAQQYPSGELTGRHAAGRVGAAGTELRRYEPDGDAARRAREQRWAEEQWTVEQQSWREAYTDPGAAGAGVPRPRAASGERYDGT